MTEWYTENRKYVAACGHTAESNLYGPAEYHAASKWEQESRKCLQCTADDGLSGLPTVPWPVDAILDTYRR